MENEPKDPTCLFNSSCLRIGGEENCQMDTAVKAFLQNRETILSGNGRAPIDTILGNIMFLQCPLYFELASYALDLTKDPARYRKYITTEPRKTE